ncbi:hypothetical protein EJB05_52376, partial [Eragrostis curvula]
MELVQKFEEFQTQSKHPLMNIVPTDDPLTWLQVRDGSFIGRWLRGCYPRTLARNCEDWLSRHSQGHGMAVEHEDDDCHAGPELRIVLDAEESDVDAPQHLLLPVFVGWGAIKQR